MVKARKRVKGAEFSAVEGRNNVMHDKSMYELNYYEW